MMNIEGYSYDILKQIKPKKVTSYLYSRGWQLENKTKVFDIFCNPITNIVVTVPNDNDYSDYPYRLEEIVRAISDSENISIPRVIASMTISASTDTMEYHYESEKSETGLIPVSDLRRIIETGDNLNNYAYRDICEYRESYASSFWKGRKALDAIRVGPTLPGSYIVQFVYPTMNSESETIGTDLKGNVLIDNEYLSRICDKIESSLYHIIEVAERNKTELEPRSQISYNFVDSVMDLNFENADMEIRRMRTLDKKNDLAKPMSLTRGVFAKISRIEEAMRPVSMETENTFIGRITLMKDPRVEPTDEPAEIGLSFIDVNGKLKSAKFKISGEELDKAYDASKKRKNVQISGKLVGAKHKKIIDIKDFKVFE